MAGEMSNRDVSSVDVVKLNSYVGKYVRLNMKKSDVTLLGMVYTIDPVSENVVLISKEEDKISFSIAFNHAIEDIEVIEEIPDNLASIDLSNLFKYTPRKKTEENPVRKEHLLKWLEISQIPYTEAEESIDVEGVLIQPPYTPNDCISNNPIKLMGLQHLLCTISQLVKNKDPRLVECEAPKMEH